MNQKYLTYACMLLLCVGLVACGQKGALVLPESQAKPEVVTPTTDSEKDKRTTTEKSQPQ